MGTWSSRIFTVLSVTVPFLQFGLQCSHFNVGPCWMNGSCGDLGPSGSLHWPALRLSTTLFTMVNFVVACIDRLVATTGPVLWRRIRLAAGYRTLYFEYHFLSVIEAGWATEPVTAQRCSSCSLSSYSIFQFFVRWRGVYARNRWEPLVVIGAFPIAHKRCSSLLLIEGRLSNYDLFFGSAHHALNRQLQQ